jgi:pyrrolidone-carboxylate peptidase
MKTLSIAISDVEYAKFGITNNILSFSDFVDMVSKELMRNNMETAIKIADASGLSSITMEDITTEVQAVRQNAKSNN